MAVMHPRVAHNYLKEGYYPTDIDTLAGVSHLLTLRGAIRALDPCAGEGTALRYLQDNLDGDVTTCGVEIDEERAILATSVLNHTLRASIYDCMIDRHCMGLLLLNPPYGELVADHLGKNEKGMNRLEVQFTRRCMGLLRKEGVLVLIVPNTSLSPAFSHYLSRQIANITVYSAATSRFKQVVIVGHRRDMREPGYRILQDDAKSELISIGLGDTVPQTLPQAPVATPYVIPGNSGSFRFELVNPDKQQLSVAFCKHGGMWSRFEGTFSQASQQVIPPPLRKLSPWHLSLALAAGQISGHVVSNDGSRQLLVKGGTKKVQRQTTTMDEAGTTTTTIDQFIPTIRAIELTPGEHFGQIFAIT